MNVKTYNLLILCVVVSFSSLSFAENLKVTPAECFLHGNQTVTLNWRYHSEKLKEKHFDKDFAFFHNGTKLENEGGGATMVVPGKPYVDYELKINKPGLYVGKVDGVNTTAVVYTIRSEANSTSAARSGDNLNLTCIDGPEEAVVLWEVDGGPVGHGVSKKYRENNDGSLTVVKIDLPHALRKISCRIFFTTDERDEYKKNKSNVPGYRTAVTAMPVLVYNTSSQSESLCILQVATWKDEITICGQRNSSDFCEKLGANISSVELDKDSNFTIYMNQKLLVIDHYKAQEEQIKDGMQHTGATNNIGTKIALVVVITALGLIGMIVLICFILRKKIACWKEKGHNSTLATDDGLVPKSDTSETKMPSLCFSCCKKDVKNNDKNTEEAAPLTSVGTAAPQGEEKKEIEELKSA